MWLSKLKNNLVRYFIVSVIFLILLVSGSVPVHAQTEQRNYLTLEKLQQKVQNTVLKDGRYTVDLSNYIIDLSGIDGEYSQKFYHLIQDAVNRSSAPLNFDFSHSIVQGELQIDQLGINSAVGEGVLSSLFNQVEQEKINQYYPTISSDQKLPRVNILRGSLNFEQTLFTGAVKFENSLLLDQFVARSAQFQESTEINNVLFTRASNFSQSVFEQNISLDQCHFFAQADFRNINFQGIVSIINSQFEDQSKFSDTLFNQVANFSHNVFIQTADFSHTFWRDRLIFAKSKFLASLLFTNASFEKNSSFRNIYANGLISLEDAHLFNRLDLSNGFFTPQANINTSGLAFDSSEAKIIGESGVIGKYIQVDRLEGNETVLRNLIRNFRSLEQIADANFLEYQREKLRIILLNDRLTKTSWRKIITLSWLSLIPQWLVLNLLLLLGNYGTNINLLFGIGIMTIVFFSLLFWLIDRYRPYSNQPVMPLKREIMIMVGTYLGLTIICIFNSFLATDQPWLTLLCMGIILLPVPLTITSLIYWHSEKPKISDTSFFVEDGSFREFRLLLGRLPIMPRFPFFRDRYQPILWNRKWSWLNYYDLSLNNIFKLGFNDIRLRDQHLPGLVSALVWYQWCLGILYIVLLLWTLSRTIPGLNLLIYF